MVLLRVCWGPRAASLQTVRWPLLLLLLRQPYVLQQQQNSSSRHTLSGAYLVRAEIVFVGSRAAIAGHNNNPI